MSRGLTCLGDVTQQHSGSLWVRALRGRSSLGSYSPKARSYQWPADAGCGFLGYAKQESQASACLAIFKIIGYVKFQV